MLGLCSCMGFSLVVASGGYSLIVTHELSFLLQWLLLLQNMGAGEYGLQELKHMDSVVSTPEL